MAVADQDVRGVGLGDGDPGIAVEDRRGTVESFEQTLTSLRNDGALPENVWIQNIPLASYAGNLSRMRSLFDEYPLSTDDRLPLEYLAPRTERDSKGSKTATTLVFEPLARFCQWVLEQSPPSADPYLAGVANRSRAQVHAGLAYYYYEALRRTGREREARAQLARYRAILGQATRATPAEPAAP